jgi:glycosyltransferase involved in cell wall biosynthesis
MATTGNPILRALMAGGNDLGMVELTSPTLTVVVPAYNEAEVLSEFHARLFLVMQGLNETWEVIFVNDGSRDGTLSVLESLHRADPHVVVLSLSRNFGKEIAITAGIDHAAGQVVIVIDADLQDPPEIIPDLVAGWREGFDTVYARRRRRDGETWLKKATANAFYRLMQYMGGVHLPPNTGDFRLISRRVVDALRQLREQHRFMKGLFAWVGFPAKEVLYDRAPRHAGQTKWNYWKLWNFAIEGITSFTVMPLTLATYFGLMIAVLAGIYMAVLVVRTILYGNPVAGYPSLMAVVLFLGGAQLFTLGIIGEYLGRIFNETKSRPLYFVERHLGAATAASSPSATQPEVPISDNSQAARSC